VKEVITVSIIGSRIKELRTELGLSQRALAVELKISASSIGMYEIGHRDPDSETLEAIADYFNVDMDYLYGKSDVKNKYAWWKSVSASVNPYEASNIIPMPKMNKIPLLGTIACGTPITAVENIEEEIDIPEHIHADFALRCKGDSMIGADIRNGDIVYIRQTPEVNDGQIAAVLIEDEATLKRVYYDKPANQITLIAENTSVRPMVYTGEALEHIKILGRAVGLSRNLV